MAVDRLFHTCLYLSAPPAEGLLKLTTDGVTFFQRPKKCPVLRDSVWGKKKKSNLFVTYNLIN